MPDPPAPDERVAVRGGRVRRWFTRVSDRARELADGVVGMRPETPVLDTAFEAVERDSRTAGGLLAGALAFRFFLLSVPLVLLLYAGLGFLDHAQSDLAATAGEQLGFSGAVLKTVSDAGRDASVGRWATLIVGTWALVLAMRTLIKTMRVIHVLAWGLDRRRLTRTVRSVFIGVGVLIAVLLYAGFGAWLRDHTPGGGLVASLLLGAGWASVWLGVSWLQPRPIDAPWTVLLPGAILVGVAAEGLHAATVLYIAGRVSRMSATYGSLGVAAVMLLWLFVVSRSIVASAMLNATLWDRRRRGVASLAPVDMRRLVRSVIRNDE
jgi:uncharacterized BrkB/YihY/UPF0761 family membrane protein